MEKNTILKRFKFGLDEANGKNVYKQYIRSMVSEFQIMMYHLRELSKGDKLGYVAIYENNLKYIGGSLFDVLIEVVIEFLKNYFKLVSEDDLIIPNSEMIEIVDLLNDELDLEKELEL